MRRIVVTVLVIATVAYAYAAGAYQLFPFYIIREGVTKLQAAIRLPGLTAAGPSRPQLLSTGLLNFDRVVVNPGRPVAGAGGGLAVAPAGLLIARQFDGRALYYDRETDQLLPTAIRLPSLNHDALPEASPRGHPIYGTDHRYNDIVLTHWDGAEHLVVSYSYFDPDKQCFTGRFAETPLPAGWVTAAPDVDLDLSWRMLLETRPCLPLKEDRKAYGGNQAGGRMTLDANGDLLVTVGDYEFDGVFATSPAYSQDPDADYGKLFRIALPSGEVTRLSMGHRNPQGIAVDAMGRIWETEHAAMGGDELNLIEPGKDYGWPTVSLGVLYTDGADNGKAWPFNPIQGGHDGYAPPVFAWIPSIAPSGLKVVAGVSPRWDGDLLVPTLANYSLHRLRLSGAEVVYDERIDMGGRVRDLEIAFGRIYLLMDDGTVVYLQPHAMIEPASRALGAPMALSALSRNGCLECHSNPNAPSLAGIGDSDVAGQPGIAYSPALQAIKGRWNRTRLTAFLRNPARFAPGTLMESSGVSGEELAAVLAELGATN